MTIKQLREALATLASEHDTKPVEVWIPGSTIRLETQGSPEETFLVIVDPDKVFIEGNLNGGSSLAPLQ